MGRKNMIAILFAFAASANAYPVSQTEEEKYDQADFLSGLPPGKAAHYVQAFLAGASSWETTPRTGIRGSGGCAGNYLKILKIKNISGKTGLSGAGDCGGSGRRRLLTQTKGQCYINGGCCA